MELLCILLVSKGSTGFVLSKNDTSPGEFLGES